MNEPQRLDSPPGFVCELCRTEFISGGAARCRAGHGLKTDDEHMICELCWSSQFHHRLRGDRLPFCPRIERVLEAIEGPQVQTSALRGRSS